MIAELLVLASLLRLDPSGDAHGAGDLVPPTAEIYSSLGPFDLVSVEVVDEPQLVVLVRLGEIPDPGGLPNGVTLPIVDVYLDTGEGGREELLPGPDMRMPSGRGWEIAIRIHGDDAFAVSADDPDDAPRPVTVIRSDDVLRVEVPIVAPAELVDVHALTGVYDPFSASGWRPLAGSASPWAFASESVVPPVVDLLAEDDETQRTALQTFTLPSSPRGDAAIGWLIAMGAGLALAIVGLWLRRRVPSPEPASATSDEGVDEPSTMPDGAAEARSDTDEGSDASIDGGSGATSHAGTDARTDARTPARTPAGTDAGAETTATPSTDASRSVPTGRRSATGSSRDGAELVLPTIWASSDGWWSDGESDSAEVDAGDDEGDVPRIDEDDVPRIDEDDVPPEDDVPGTPPDDDEPDAPHLDDEPDAPHGDEDDVRRDDEEAEHDGGPRPGARRTDGAS